jgi:uncharacterized surface protein with fasciclin (FAS1) repeats
MDKPKKFTKKRIVIIIIIIILLAAGGASAYYAFFSRRIGGSNPEDSSQKSNTQAATKDLLTLMAENSSLTSFGSLLTASGVKFTLQTVGTNYLVLAPNNDGCKSLPAGYFDSLLTVEKQPVAQNIAKYHVALLPTVDLTDGQKLKTLAGQEVIVGLKNGKYTFTDAKGNVANLIGNAQKATNGSLYVLDSILLPQ